MHIIGLIIAVLSGAAFWYWRLSLLRDAGSDAIDTVERMRGAMRRRSFRQKAETSTLASIKNRAIAAAVLCCRLANEKPQYKEEALAGLRTELEGIVAPQDMDEILVFADWAARDILDPKEPVRRFKPLWLDALNAQERTDLVKMAERVAAAGGRPSPLQEMALETLRRGLIDVT